MNNPIEHTYRTLAQIAAICSAQGVKNAVLSPGSRSAPLALSFIRNKDINHFILPDERSAAYTALGIARQTQSPVVLVCTSGTAALNYAPAIAEAFFSEIPLIVLTADRPPEWIAQADNQSIYQENIYGKHVKAFYNFPVEFTHPDAVWQAQRQMNEGLILSMEGKRGPVHINVPLREPLYLENPVKDIPEPGIIISERISSSISSGDKLISELKNFSKVLFVAGSMPPDKELTAALEQINGINFIADITSNLHSGQGAILHSDLIIDSSNEEKLASLCPDLLISFGGPIVSKHLKNFLRRNEIKEHWHIGESPVAADTFQNLTRVINVSPKGFIAEIAANEIEFDEEYYSLWQTEEITVSDNILSQQKELLYSETKAVMQVLKAIPARSVLHLGNSLPIRHVTSFPIVQNISEIYSNRGTSGIDGSLSSAAGHSMVDERIHVCILGDLSFMYDSNGLWNKYLKENLKIIILNNHGGRIFESLPGAAMQAEINEYFVTDQPLTFEHMALQHKCNYAFAENEEQLEEQLFTFFRPADTISILELRFRDGISLGDVKKMIV